MIPVLLFRRPLAEAGEIEVAARYFDVVDHRAGIRAFGPEDNEAITDSNQVLVVPRYSSLPH